ncbi:MAG TPA: WYL domain-containing protein [Candidatus Limnocylindrales bacterium]|jgi:predicted DNA-binding transcriptional regulator YafY
MRASRLINLLLLLQTRGQLTAAELASELEVSERTVHRDIEALSAAGVPVYAVRGPHGGVALVDGYRTRLTGMTGEEAEALFLSGIPGPAAELGLGTVMAAARLKVLAALPPELRSRASRLVERFHLDVTGWFQTGEEAPLLPALSEAVWESRRVDAIYERNHELVERSIKPLGLVLKAGIWYLVADSDGQYRTYRVARFRQASVSDDRFERPTDFELASYWTESTAAYEENAERLEVTLRISHSAMHALADIAGSAALRAAERLTPPEGDRDGWEVLRLRMDWPSEVPARLVALGADAEVLEPIELRPEIAAIAQRVVDRYSRPTDRAGANGPPDRARGRPG